MAPESTDFVTREELNALGAKVSSLSEGCVACKTRLTQDVLYLQEGLKEAQRDVKEIKQMIQGISDQVNKLTIKVSIIVAIIVGVLNFLTPVLKDVVAK